MISYYGLAGPSGRLKRVVALEPDIAVEDMALDAYAATFLDAANPSPDWRRAAPRLGDWLAGFAVRPSLVSTRPH